MREDGVKEALGAFYGAHRQELFTYALSITRSAASAEDAIHEAFSRVLARPRFPRELRPYVFRCVRNAALDLLRWAEREQQKIAGYGVLFHNGGSEGVEESVADALAALSDKEREIVVLKAYSGLTFKEIAEVCGAPQGTVAANYWRSLQKMRERLKPAAGTEEMA